LAVGPTLKVRLSTVQTTSGTWTTYPHQDSQKAMPDRIKADNVSFQRGSASNLGNGVSVKVKGQSYAGSTTVQAVRIKFAN
jgi:hypothetical protein